MPKKKATALVKVPMQLVTGPAAHERALKAADAEWEKAQQEAQTAYDMATKGAWSRYTTALRAHTGKSSAGTDFDKQYDKDREIALKVWKETTERADRKLKATLDAIGGDQIIDD